MKRYWISWEQLTSDYRPLQDPPQPENIRSWRCSGHSPDGATICAIVDAESEDQAKEFVLNAWDASGTGEEIGRWRFAEEKAADWLPGDRFPISKDWERKRLGLAK